MSEERKPNTAVMTAGLGGFVLGALTVLFIVWAYTGFRTADGLPTADLPQAVARPAPAQPAPEIKRQPPVTPAAADLRQRNLVLPVQGIRPEQLQNTFEDSRSGGRVHEAIDIMAPRNTPVLAVEDGKVAKLFTSKQGGLTLYQFDPNETYAYYYAHLERYADGITEGMMLRRGQLVGYVGTSGNASPEGPHLHFAIFQLTPEKRWWDGAPVNPFPALGGQGAERVEPAR